MSKKLLVIEDDADTRMLLEEVFSMSGCEVETAEDADEAIFKLENSSAPDLIFSDLHVPGADGNGEIVSIVRDHLDKDVPIILMSGADNIRELASKLNVDFIRKPVDISNLMNLVR